jgi:hypothetical protein
MKLIGEPLEAFVAKKNCKTDSPWRGEGIKPDSQHFYSSVEGSRHDLPVNRAEYLPER